MPHTEGKHRPWEISFFFLALNLMTIDNEPVTMGMRQTINIF